MVSRSRFQNPFPFRIGTTTDPTTGTAATATIRAAKEIAEGDAVNPGRTE
ncbi:MAG: hypothetical protein V5A34_01395 [Halapricum sp.]